jgi:ribosomal protein S27E
MSNFLDLRCPNCDDDDQVDILAKSWVRVTDEGTDPDQAGNRDWCYTPASAAECGVCGHSGVLADFEPSQERRGTP